MTAERRDLMEQAVEWAQAAGRITLRWFQAGVEVDLKSDGSPVTRADRDAETFLRDVIARHRPGDGILGEEFGETRPGAPRRWVLDPIDGTKSFACGVPLYGVMVALEEEGRAVLGVVHFPALGETVWAATGLGCWWDGRPARVSLVDRIERAVLLTSDVNGLERIGRGVDFRRLTGACAWTRTWGDCYGHVLVATGRAEGIVDPKLAVWDAAPLVPIVEEAGGRFTTFDGSPWYGGPGAATNAIVTNTALAGEIRARFAGPATG